MRLNWLWSSMRRATLFSLVLVALFYPLNITVILYCWAALYKLAGPSFVESHYAVVLLAAALSHFAIYCGVAYLVAWALRKRPVRVRALSVILTGVLYGGAVSVILALAWPVAL